jgi:hypothetical protein
MRKVSLILAVLLFAVPAWARVDIICVQTDSNEVTVSYVIDYPNPPGEEPNKIRAFALDITLDNDANITDVNDNVNDYYTIFPGSVVISDNEITDEGEAVADPCDYPEDTQPGLDSNGVTIEMGGLWSPPNDDHPNAPPVADILLKFYVDKSCYVTITENDIRGGVVLTDPALDPDVNSPGEGNVPPVYVEVLEDCLIGGYADEGVPGSEYARWEAFGKPDCWCYCRQCRGDIDGSKIGPFYVQSLDLALFRAAFNERTLPEGGECADLNHIKTGPFNVQALDLAIFRTYFNQRTGVPTCDVGDPDPEHELPDPYTGPYNFWCDPCDCPGVCPYIP